MVNLGKGVEGESLHAQDNEFIVNDFKYGT